MYNINKSSLKDKGHETDLLNMWEDFSMKNKVPLYGCISAVLKRRILVETEWELQDDNLIKDVFHILCICGLPSVIEKLLFCDRFIQF